jgi:hypothetical protein
MGTFGQTLEEVVGGIRQKWVHLFQTLENDSGCCREDKYVLASSFQESLLAEGLDPLLQGLDDSVSQIVDNVEKQFYVDWAALLADWETSKLLVY